MFIRALIVTIFALWAMIGNATVTPTYTLKQKIGQMLIIGFKGMALAANDPIVGAIKKQQVGGVILFDYDFALKEYERNIANPQQLQALTASLVKHAQASAIAANSTYLPLLISIDYEGGHVNRLKAEKGFPKTYSAKALGNMPLNIAKPHMQVMAHTLQSLGINLDYAPNVDVDVNPDNPIIGKLERSYASNYKKVISYGKAMAAALAEKNILCAYKHFPGHGSSKQDSHLGFVDITNTWQPQELSVFKELLRAKSGYELVMVAHVIHKGLDAAGYPATLSFAVIHDLLRKQLGFDGVVVTDDMQMKAITDNFSLEEALRLAINAGVDMLIFGNQLVTTPQDPEQIIDIIYHDVQAGKIKESRIEEAYQRILRLKAKLR